MPEKIKLLPADTEDNQTTEIDTKNLQFTVEEQTTIDKYKSYIAQFSKNITSLKVAYDDLSVLLRSSPELEFVNKFFSDITSQDKGIEKLLYEVIGYSFFKTAKLNKAIILKGFGRNGKSKIFRVIEAILSNNCPHEHLEGLVGNKSANKTTIKALQLTTCNISEDQKNVKYINTGILTRLISGEPISLENKDRNVYLTSYATLLFSVNEVIRFKELGLHITDRFIVIPFNATFTDATGNRDIDIERKLCKNDKVLQIIATKAIKAFSIVLKNGKFTIPANVEAETKKYFMECDNVFEFCSLFPIETFISKSQYYQEYYKWCEETNNKPLDKGPFGKQVLSLNYRSERYSFKGNRDTYYVNPVFTNDRATGVYQAFIADTYEANKDEVDNNKHKNQNNMLFENYLWDRIDKKRLLADIQAGGTINSNNSITNNIIEGQITLFDDFNNENIEELDP